MVQAKLILQGLQRLGQEEGKKVVNDTKMMGFQPPTTGKMLV